MATPHPLPVRHAALSLPPHPHAAGFRYLLRRYLPEPLNTLACIPVAAAVQLPLSWLTSDSWLPDPLLRVQVKNAHKWVML